MPQVLMEHTIIWPDFIFSVRVILEAWCQVLSCQSIVWPTLQRPSSHKWSTVEMVYSRISTSSYIRFFLGFKGAFTTATEDSLLSFHIIVASSPCDVSITPSISYANMPRVTKVWHFLVMRLGSYFAWVVIGALLSLSNVPLAIEASGRQGC